MTKLNVLLFRFLPNESRYSTLLLCSNEAVPRSSYPYRLYLHDRQSLPG